jgi:DNA-binding transcriptional LysR family regulator
MVDAAIAGYGIAYVPEDGVAAQIADGRLELVLDKWSPKFGGYHLYYPSRRRSSPACHVIIDALRHQGEPMKREAAFVAGEGLQSQWR